MSYLIPPALGKRVGGDQWQIKPCINQFIVVYLQKECKYYD